jgi:periplasmic protein TonB
MTIAVMDWWNRSRLPMEYVVPGPSTTAIRPEAEPSAPTTLKTPEKKPLRSATPTRSNTSFIGPKLVKRVEPKYTAYAASRKIEGKVKLSFVVMPNGNVRTIRVIRRLDTGLDRSAIEALSHWRYSPALVDGRPTAVQRTEEIAFHLP